MKTLSRFLSLSFASCLIMTVVDYFLGAKAEFLNAFSVLERLIGREPSAGESLVAAQFGATGEFLGVVAASVVVGGILTILVEFWTKNR